MPVYQIDQGGDELNPICSMFSVSPLTEGLSLLQAQILGPFLGYMNTRSTFPTSQKIPRSSLSFAGCLLCELGVALPLHPVLQRDIEVE